MDPLLILSPHLDDAVLSAGQLMAGRPDCAVVTVFAGVPENFDELTSYDEHSGFRSAQQAVTRRRAEDQRALETLQARGIRLDFTDAQYKVKVSAKEIAVELQRVADEVRPDVVLGPLGLVHEDHLTCRQAYAELLRRRPHLEGWIYEELPSRVLWPETVPPALEWWRAAGWRVTQGFLGTGTLTAKGRALRCYRSQRWALDRHSCFVPERLWQLEAVA